MNRSGCAPGDDATTSVPQSPPQAPFLADYHPPLTEGAERAGARRKSSSTQGEGYGGFHLEEACLGCRPGQERPPVVHAWTSLLGVCLDLRASTGDRTRDLPLTEGTRYRLRYQGEVSGRTLVYLQDLFSQVSRMKQPRLAPEVPPCERHSVPTLTGLALRGERGSASCWRYQPRRGPIRNPLRAKVLPPHSDCLRPVDPKHGGQPGREPGVSR